MEENKISSEKKIEEDINQAKIPYEITENNIENLEQKTIDQSPTLLDNSFQNMSNKFITHYQNEELNKFQDEILSFFKNRDNYFFNLIQTYKAQIKASEKKYENLAKLIKLNYEEILSSQASLNNRLDKFNSYESFVAKTNDNLTSHEIRINNLREDYTKTVQKYDKIYLDNLELPGYIGRCAKYKNCQLFFEDVIKEINKFNNYKEKNNLDLKTYKDKLEYNIKTFRNLLNNNNDAQIQYLNKLNEKNLKESKNMVDNLAERVMELRLENSKHSLDLITRTNEINQQMDKIKEMKGELLNEFYNKIDDYKIETNKAINSFNEFKNEYNIIRKKFLELAEFIKDIRFRKNLGVEVNKKEINDLYKSLIKKNKKCNKDKNVELLNDISKIEKLEFNINKTNTIDNTNKENNIRGFKKHETFNYTKNVFKGNLIELKLNNNKKENNKNSIEIININNNNEIKNKDDKGEIHNEDNNLEVNKSLNDKLIYVLKENNTSRSSKNIFNIKMNLETEKEKLMKNTYDNTEDLNKINKAVINDSIKEEQKNEKEDDILKLSKIHTNSMSKLTTKEKEKKYTTDLDTISITDSCCSFNITNTILPTGSLSEKNNSNISLPIAYNSNTVKCNKFVLNDICQNEHNNKIIKELAAELEQSTAKKNKKILNKNSENTIQKIEPVNLIKNIKDIKDNNEVNDSYEIKNKSSDKIELKEVEKKLRNQSSKSEQKQPILINNQNQLKSLINEDNENESKDSKIKSKGTITNIKNMKEINSPKSDINNIEKIYNFNSDIDTNTETINSKIGVFGQKLSDIEIFMKNKFIELTKQINEIKLQNTSKKQNLNRTVGYKSDKNIFNFLNNDHCTNNYSLNIRDEIPNVGNYRVIKLQKPDIYSHFFPSDVDNIKRLDYFKDSFTVDNWNKNKENRNDDLSVIKQFIEKKINIKNKNQEIYKKNVKSIFRDKNINFINNANGGIDAYDSNHSKAKNNSTSIKNDIKYVDLKVLMNRKIPKNSNFQKINIFLSGEK